jgi:hypothetical protein
LLLSTGQAALLLLAVSCQEGVHERLGSTEPIAGSLASELLREIQGLVATVEPRQHKAI